MIAAQIYIRTEQINRWDFRSKVQSSLRRTMKRSFFGFLW